MKRFFLAAALAVAASGAGAQSAAAPPKIPLATFAEQPFLADPVLSPDGKRIAVRLSSKGNEAIGIYDVPLDAARPPKVVLNKSNDVRSFSWAGSDRLLITRQSFAVSLDPIAVISISQMLRYDLKDSSLLALGKPGNGQRGHFHRA